MRVTVLHFCYRPTGAVVMTVQAKNIHTVYDKEPGWLFHPLHDGTGKSVIGYVYLPRKEK